MKAILIVLLVFKISSCVSDKENPNNCVYKSPQCILSTEATRLSKNYCESFNLVKQYRVLVGETNATTRYKQKCFDDCITTIKPHFQKVDETNESINKFHTLCKGYGLTALYCGEIMKHLNVWCFNMESAVELLWVVDKEKYIDTKNGYKEITILHKDWNEFKNIGNVNIQDCLPEFKAETFQSSRFVMRMFKQWFDMDNNSASRCNCIEIFGIYKIYEAKVKNLDPKGRPKPDTYFQTLCLPANENDIEKLHVWKSSQFQEIADKAETVKLEHIKSFLFEGTKIAKSKWFDCGASHPTLHFDYMIKEIKFEEKGYKTRITFLSVVLNCVLSTSEYKIFRDEVSGDKDCVTLGCWIRKFEEYRKTLDWKLDVKSESICMTGITTFKGSNEMMFS